MEFICWVGAAAPKVKDPTPGRVGAEAAVGAFGPKHSTSYYSIHKHIGAMNNTDNVS